MADGIESALEHAGAARATLTSPWPAERQQYLRAGLVDEIQLHVAAPAARRR